MFAARSPGICSVAALLLFGASVANAIILGPYSPDGATLHLWHLNEGVTPAIDSASGGTNLTSLANGATLGGSAFPGFGSALNTYDGGPAGAAATAKDSALSALPLVNGPTDNISFVSANPVNGAFTYEALVRIDFDPATVFNTIANGGNGRTNQMVIIAAEDDSNGGRVFQFRIDPVGTATNTQPFLEFINVNLGVSVQNITVPIPTNGPNAIVSNGWFHVAVSYDGNAGGAGNIKFYWTLLDSSRTNANLIGSATMNQDLPNAASTDFAIGNTGRGTPNANFVGVIDEVRMSSVARADTEMIFGNTGPPPSITNATYLDCLVDFERHAETIWHTAAGAGRPPDSGYFGDGNSTGNGGIRGNCGVALAYAVLVRSLPGNPTNTTRLARIRQALNYAANTHESGTNTCIDGLQWGHDWQTSLWAGSMGFACFLVQDQLPAATVQAVQRAIADEATYRAGVPPASGYVSDTKAEENGWNGNVVALAAAWLSTNANATNWLISAKKYLANTYTVPDTTGDPLASWVTTTTLYPSFALENHGFYHPTYQMVSGMSMGDSLLMARMANPVVAAELQPFAEHNVLNVWSNLNHLLLDSGELGYPSGLDWELHDFEHNSYISWIATHFNDPVARHADSNLVKVVRYRQIVNGDGRFVGPSVNNGFFREAVEARRTAIAWLHQTTGGYTNGPTTPAPDSFEHLPDVKIVAHRSAWGMAAFSYGPRIMGIIEPASANIPTNAFMTTPRVPGIIGLGALGNPTSAQLISLTANAIGFDAELLLQNSSQGTTEVHIKSTGETIAIVEVPTGSASGNSGSFIMGIENDPLIGGSRLLEWTGGSATMTNRSGASRNVTNGWLCVGGRLGMLAGPAGYFAYQTASSYNRPGAAEDSLQFKPADVAGARYAVWFPTKNAAQTAVGASLVSWTNTNGVGTLTFPGPTGSVHQINVAIAAPPPYPPYPVSSSSVTASSSQPGFPPTNAVDGNANTFWVSSGVSPGQGPTTNNPEWLQFTFPRTVAVSKIQVAPRTTNGGYGPKDVQLLLNGIVVYQGTMAPTTTLDVPLSPPINATNAQLLITSSYDPNFPTNSRNVQVVEVVFWERALPGTFGDWAVRNFNDTQLADPAIGASDADPDQDGAVNFLEFTMGGAVLSPDASNFKLKNISAAVGQFSVRFTERKQLVGVTREFLSSSNLTSWTAIAPLNLQTVQDLGETAVLQATFPVQTSRTFFRLSYHP